MAKSNQPKAKKSVLVIVFNIIFLVLAILLVAYAIMLFVPAISKNIKGMIPEGFQNALNSFISSHICDVFHFSTTFRGHSQSFTSCFYLFLMSAGIVLGLFLMYMPFLVRRHNTKRNKNQGWRKVLSWIIFALTTIVIAFIITIPFRAQLSFLEPVYQLIDKYVAWFAPGNKLNFLVFETITSNTSVWALSWFLIVWILFEDIFIFIAMVGKGKQSDAVPTTNNENEVLIENRIIETHYSATLREVSLLNSLEPIFSSKIQNLPGIEPIDTEAVIKEFESELPKPRFEDAETSLAVEPHRANVDVLPGIDEWNASPWDTTTTTLDEIPVEETQAEAIQTEETQTEEKNDAQPEIEDITSVAAPEEIQVPISGEIISEETSTITIANIEEKTEDNKLDENDLLDVDESVNNAIPEEIVSEDKPLVKPVHPIKPVNPPSVKQVELKQFVKKEDKKPITPIAIHTVVTPPAIQEEPVVEESNDIVLAPIVSPLHDTNKYKHDKIAAVSTKRVIFSKKNYRLKTYFGSLTPEQAFLLGVTKVQPGVSPVFDNQGHEPIWKIKRRKEEIRKNGYGNVSHIDLSSQGSLRSDSEKMYTSIRDIRKANKLSTPVVEKEAEQTNTKPTSPIEIKPVIQNPTIEEEPKEKEQPLFIEPLHPDFSNRTSHKSIKPIEIIQKKR